jgi:DNA-binding transcriptional ArsR family regulator
MQKLAKFIKVISDSNRLAIINVIGHNDRSVTELINSTRLSQTLVSFHLRILRQAGVVNSRRAGPFIYYSLSDVAMLTILGDLAMMAGLKNSLFCTCRSGESLKITNAGGR